MSPRILLALDRFLDFILPCPHVYKLTSGWYRDTRFGRLIERYTECQKCHKVKRTVEFNQPNDNT